MAITILNCVLLSPAIPLLGIYPQKKYLSLFVKRLVQKDVHWNTVYKLLEKTGNNFNVQSYGENGKINHGSCPLGELL